MSETLVLDAEGRFSGDGDAERQLQGRAGPWRLVPTSQDLLVLHRERPSGTGDGPRVVVCGDVSGFGLGDLLAALGMGRWTGVVRVRAGEVERELGLRQGRVVQAFSNNPEDALDAVLARARLGRARRPRPAELAQAVRRQAEEIFCALLRMAPGVFFLVDAPVCAASGVDLELDHLLLEALRRQDEAGRDRAAAGR